MGTTRVRTRASQKPTRRQSTGFFGIRALVRSELAAEALEIIRQFLLAVRRLAAGMGGNDVIGYHQQ